MILIFIIFQFLYRSNIGIAKKKSCPTVRENTVVVNPRLHCFFSRKSKLDEILNDMARKEIQFENKYIKMP